MVLILKIMIPVLTIPISDRYVIQCQCIAENLDHLFSVKPLLTTLLCRKGCQLLSICLSLGDPAMFAIAEDVFRYWFLSYRCAWEYLEAGQVPKLKRNEKRNELIISDYDVKVGTCGAKELQTFPHLRTYDDLLPATIKACITQVNIITLRCNH